MKNFVFAYYGGNMDMPMEEGKKHQEKFMNWLEDIGDDVINPGTPLSMTTLVSSEGIADEESANRLTGFSMIKAADKDAAIELAKKCPFVEIGGTVGVSEAMQMN